MARRVYGACRNIAAFTSAIGATLPVHRQRHLAAQNDVRGFRGVRVIWIRRVRRILHIGVPEAFLLESARELLLVHPIILSNVQRFRSIPAPENGYALPAALGDTAERARPSSGEKTVRNHKIRRWASEAEVHQRTHPQAERREIRADDHRAHLARLPSPCNPKAR
jgi:hypothetical protein